GGVTADNIRQFAAAGADTFGAGSAVFGAKNRAGYQRVIEAMRAEIARAGEDLRQLRAEVDRELKAGA
ncbi:MAG: hypothetical protein ACK50B_02425, partial [Betaproteobacteria bacterium]